MLTISPISPMYLPDISPISPEVAELGCLFTDGALCLEAEVLFYTPAFTPLIPPLTVALDPSPSPNAALTPFRPVAPFRPLPQVLFYTSAQCPPREACAGRRLVCVPHYPRTAQGAIDLEALRTLPLRELAGRPPPATLSAAPCNPKCRPLQP